MVNLWNFLKPNKNNEVEFKPLVRDPLANDAGLRADGTFARGVPFEALQVDAGGNITTQPSRPERKKGLSFYERLVGQQAKPTDSIDMSNGSMNATISNNPRRGGLLRDFAGGYNENRFTPASLENFGQNELADGRNKGFAYRFGEGIGSIARVLDSPLGRGLLTAGLIGTVGGGSPFEALAFGGTAGAMNQKYRTNDRMYRNDLIATQQNALRNSESFNQLSDAEKAQVLQSLQNDENYINSQDETAKSRMLADAENQYLYNRQLQQLGDIENNINRMRGYLTPETYNNFIRSQQLRENADWKRMYFDANQANLQNQREWQRQQAEQTRADNQARFEYQKANDAANRAIRYADLNDRRTQRAIDNYYKNQELEIKKNAAEAKLNKTLYKNSQEQNATLNQIQQIRNYVNKNPKATGLAIGSLTGDIANRFDSNPQHIATRTMIDDFKTKIRHDLTGAAFSAKEAREYEKFLPNTRDTKEIINAKLDALESKITGGNNIPRNINVNQSAIQAEMRRRGLM